MTEEPVCSDDHQVKPENFGNCGRIVRDLTSDCIVMVAVGRSWKTWFA